MDDNLSPMGYQGEDGSRTRANSRRQPPWQSSSDPGQADYGDGYDAHAPDDSYAGYDAYDHGRDGYGGSGGYPAQPGGYGSGGYPAQADSYGGSGGYPAQPDGYRGSGGYPAQPDGYGSGGYPAQPDGYGSGGYPAQPDSYGGSGGYPAQPDSYGGSGGYPAQPDSYGGSGGYQAQPGGYGSGGYPAQPGGYGSGGYPALGNGAEAEDVAGRYAGNDWYGGRPAGASGSGAGFADTGTYNLDARTIDAYGSGPYPAAREAADPPGLVHTGEQERYDGQYGAYAGYEDHGEYQDAPGYGPSQGFDQGGYGQGYESRDDYDDPYQDRYGDDGTAPPAGKPGKGGKGRKPRKTGKNPYGKRRLLIAGTAVVVVGILAAAGYVFVLKPKPSTVTPTSAAPLPSPGTGSAATAACVKQFGQYCHIELRTDDPAPLTLAELFPPAFVNETDHGSFTRAGTKLDTTCSKAVIGQDLTSALQDGKCTQVLRASYFSGDGKMMGTIGVANLSTTNEAHHAGKVVGNSDFVDPLSTTTGVTSKLGKGTGIVEAEYKGHYLIMIWAEFTSTNAPANNTQDQQLQQFGADLIAGTANISLSQRMLNGHPATAAS